MRICEKKCGEIWKGEGVKKCGEGGRRICQEAPLEWDGVLEENYDEGCI